MVDFNDRRRQQDESLKADQDRRQFDSGHLKKHPEHS